MADLLFLLAILLPLVVPYLAGWQMSRGFEHLTTEDRAKRSYRLSWLVSFCMLAQMGLPVWIVSQWADSMQLALILSDAMDGGVHLLRAYLGPGLAAALVTTLAMFVMAIDLIVMCIPLFRVMRLNKGLAGGTQHESKMALRGFLGSQVPMLAWIVLINAVPPEWLLDPVVVSLGLIAFATMQFVFAPFFVQLANPTEPMSTTPIETMCKTLCAKAGIRFGGVRLLKYGDVRIANALVCGLTPWYRRIYISDHLLAVFSLDEVRAILSHEIGHMKKGHLWWYLAFAVIGGQIAGPIMNWMADCGVNVFFAFLGYFCLLWGVMFSLLSRRFERQADRYALELTGDKAVLIAALEKLAAVNCTTRTWSRWDIFQRHPDIAARVAGL